MFGDAMDPARVANHILELCGARGMPRLAQEIFGGRNIRKIVVGPMSKFRSQRSTQRRNNLRLRRRREIITKVISQIQTA
jgi:ribosome maturation protein Sdo1